MGVQMPHSTIRRAVGAAPQAARRGRSCRPRQPLCLAALVATATAAGSALAQPAEPEDTGTGGAGSNGV
ncbi:MAG: hypothetical protein AAGG09_20505, partial [Pseudomonadota bacterium]